MPPVAVIDDEVDLCYLVCITFEMWHSTMLVVSFARYSSRQSFDKGDRLRGMWEIKMKWYRRPIQESPSLRTAHGQQSMAEAEKPTGKDLKLSDSNSKHLKAQM